MKLLIHVYVSTVCNYFKSMLLDVPSTVYIGPSPGSSVDSNERYQSKGCEFEPQFDQHGNMENHGVAKGVFTQHDQFLLCPLCFQKPSLSAKVK